MAETQKQEWSKERIQAEMKDVEDAAKGRFYFGLPLVIAAVFAIFFGVLTPFVNGGVRTVFILAGIPLGVGGILLIRGVLAKRREYNELRKDSRYSCVN